jgi:hypothetical protein
MMMMMMILIKIKKVTKISNIIINNLLSQHDPTMNKAIQK